MRGRRAARCVLMRARARRRRRRSVRLACASYSCHARARRDVSAPRRRLIVRGACRTRAHLISGTCFDCLPPLPSQSKYFRHSGHAPKPKTLRRARSCRATVRPRAIAKNPVDGQLRARRVHGVRVGLVGRGVGWAHPYGGRAHGRGPDGIRPGVIRDGAERGLRRAHELHRHRNGRVVAQPCV